MNFKHIRTVLNILLDLAIVLSVHMMFLFFYVLVTILLQKIDYLFSCELYIDFGLLKIGNFTAVLKNIFGGGGGIMYFPNTFIHFSLPGHNRIYFDILACTMILENLAQLPDFDIVIKRH